MFLKFFLIFLVTSGCWGVAGLADEKDETQALCTCAGSPCPEPEPILDTEKEKRGIIAHSIVQYLPSSPPLNCLQYCAIYFPHVPLYYCNKNARVNPSGAGARQEACAV